MRSLSFQRRDDSQAPEDLSGTGNSRQTFPQGLFGATDIIFAEFDQSQRKIILVIVRIALDGLAENFLSAGRVAEMSMDIAQQRQVSIVLLACGRNLLGSFERLRIEAFAKIRISQIKSHVVGNRIRAQGRLEMLNSVVVQTVAGQQYAHSSLCAVIA